VTRNAQTAVRGKEFVLLVDEGERMRCRSSSILSAECIAALERWADRGRKGHELETVLDDLTLVPELASLPRDRALPLRSLCAAPLRYHGNSLGVLVALANGENSFLPHDVELLQSYASQAAIALANARLYEAQQALASRDPLTELLNHREFHEQLGRELERCRRHGGEVSVALLDVDDFKHVNDTGGHAAGDRVLTDVARALCASTREEDVAFRVGGDEFAVLLPATGPREAIRVVERAGEAIRALPGRVSVSYGIGGWPGDGPSKETVLARADTSLYGMKRAAIAPQGPAARTPESEIDRQRKRLASASRLSSKLAHLLDPGEIARATVDELYETFGYHLAVVQRACDDGFLRPAGGAGSLTREMDGFEDWAQPKNEGVNGRAFRTGEPVLVPDTSLDPDFIGTNAPRNAGSELALPIRVAGEVWGVLNIEELETHAFGPDDLVFADVMAAHVGAALDRNRLFGELENTFFTTLAVLSDALESKDAYTAAHARDVADLTDEVGVALGLDPVQMRTLRYGALLHDIGKIAIPTEILTKPSKLTEDEFEVIKQHTVIGARMLERIPFFDDVHPVVRSAHERWDGRGYPDGLATSEIPLEARIVCACDAFHAMTSDRPYRDAMPVVDAVAELRRNAGRQFDPTVVDALVQVAMGHLSAAGQRG
jgi:diguanylate cyclase (GGDEF)-like protein/putative nucleotidyltransferase with HDIG domain